MSMISIPGNREKVTIYFTSEFTGQIRKLEGRLVQIDDLTAPGRAARGADVWLVRKGARQKERVSSSFWVLADGWGHPDPARVAEGELSHLSHAPELVSEFIMGPGSRLPARAMLHDKRLTIYP
jgi:hypothetical protein